MNDIGLARNMDNDEKAFPKKLEEVNTKSLFGFSSNMKVYGFKEKTKFVPDHDESYVFDEVTTKAILAGFSYNRRVMIQGYHGTGKSTHIEQVASRLNWPCIRINLDSHISRLDLVGKDEYEVIGDLTIKGITKTITLRGKNTGFIDAGMMGGKRAGFSATAMINRKDFGLNWNRKLDQGGLLVGNEVTIELKIQAVAST